MYFGLLKKKERSFMIYFVQAGINGPIKIGITNNINRRIKELEKEAPYELNILAEYPGGRKFEKRIHTMFQKFRIRGEWFRPEEELLFWMENIIITPTKIFFDSGAKFIPTTGWEREHA